MYRNLTGISKNVLNYHYIQYLLYEHLNFVYLMWNFSCTLWSQNNLHAVCNFVLYKVRLFCSLCTMTKFWVSWILIIQWNLAKRGIRDPASTKYSPLNEIPRLACAVKIVWTVVQWNLYKWGLYKWGTSISGEIWNVFIHFYTN